VGEGMMFVRASGLRYLGAVALVGALLTGVAWSGGRPADGKPSPAVPAKPARASHLPGYNLDRNAYFGDLHVHTYLSNDAYIFNVRRTPDDAYRFARGEAIGHAGGFDIRLAGGPLDFVAVTDHAEFMSAIREAAKPDTPLHALPFTQGLFSTDPAQIQKAFTAFAVGRQTGSLPKEFNNPDIVSRAWKEVQEAAARNNQPGKFTTLVGYEYTSAPGGRNLHRNVIFRSAKVPDLPYSSSESADPENLWRTMDIWRGKGIQALAIPHNANGSDGLMFDSVRMNGQSIDRAYAELRARNEPLTEITQIKGTSETHPTLSPNDEWANFEIMDSYIGRDIKVTKFAGSYVRRALEDGLLMRDKLGINGFKLGFIGSSDTHNAAPGSVEEPNYFSKVGRTDGTADLRRSIPPYGARTWDGVPMPDPKAPTVPPSSLGGQRFSRGLGGGKFSRRDLRCPEAPGDLCHLGATHPGAVFAGYSFPADLTQRTDAVHQPMPGACPWAAI